MLVVLDITTFQNVSSETLVKYMIYIILASVVGGRVNVQL